MTEYLKYLWAYFLKIYLDMENNGPTKFLICWKIIIKSFWINFQNDFSNLFFIYWSTVEFQRIFFEFNGVAIDWRIWNSRKFPVEQSAGVDAINVLFINFEEIIIILLFQ